MTRTPSEVFSPGEFIRDELEERGWTQSDLATILDRPLAAVNQIEYQLSNLRIPMQTAQHVARRHVKESIH